MKRKILGFLIVCLLVGLVNIEATTKTLAPDSSISGSILSGGSPRIWKGSLYYKAGDTSSNYGRRCLLSFDLSSLPGNAIITDAKLYLTTYTLTRDPFGGLGKMYVEQVRYGDALTLGAYSTSSMGGTVPVFSSASHINPITVTSKVKNELSSGYKRFQVRIRFYKTSDSDGKTDDIKFTNPKLTITYTTLSTPPPTITVIPMFFPDLTVSDIFTSPSGYIAFSINNIGNADVSSKTMTLKVYKNGVLIYNNPRTLTIPVDGTVNLYMTQSSAKVTGTDDVKVVVDANNNIAEWNEDNNERTETLTEIPPATEPPTEPPPTEPPATEPPTEPPPTEPPTVPPTTTPAPIGTFSLSKPEYKQGEAVEMYLESTGTTPIKLQNTAPWTVYKIEGGLFEVYKPVAAEVITEVTGHMSWIWNQKNNLDENVPEGQYKIVLRTLNAGEYSASFTITGEAATEPPTTHPPTTQPTTTESPLSSLLENPIVLIGGALVLLLLVLIIVIALKK